MDTLQMQHDQWRLVRDRLRDKDLLHGTVPGVSLRVPGTQTIWFGHATADAPTLIGLADLADHDTRAALHADLYACREDVCAVVIGAGCYGLHLADFGGSLPGLFDEQVRHLGLMPPPLQATDLQRQVRASSTNVLCIGSQPVVLGMTGERLALNAEIFEKCAKAYVLAAATGKPVSSLPWIVRWVANSRLEKEQRRARQRTRQGLLPEETKGY